jgi:alkanesulfonate monooxygenase SsuD/methylene tetrahydromethanopterin reductase-like flavin-dependent oxidoreductase (luciferase family)
MPLLIGGNGPRGQRAAVRFADIYSCYVEERAVVDEVGPRLRSMEAICAELGRDPASIGRSVGVSVRPLEPAGVRPDVISGSAEEIADAFRTFRGAGFTQLEIMFGPGTMEALEALAPVVEAIHTD